MKNTFRGFYKLSDDEFKILWANAIFVFDTNILLNLYRYQPLTRDLLLAVIAKLGQRAWLPYHVALEYQRNRLKVVAAQHKRFAEVRNIVSQSIQKMQGDLDKLQLKSRHSHINPDKLSGTIEKAKEEFFLELSELEKKSISPISSDEIRIRLDKLFDGKIGPHPKTQETIDEIFKEAESRYKKAIPPGFEDSCKDEKTSDEFTYGGLVYKRKYGDFMIWKQILEYAKEKKLRDLIFVTDDSKPDWWLQIDCNGNKTIGIRPELIDEASRLAGVERFYAYNTEGFLNYAKTFLDAKVTEDAIEEVRAVSIIRRSKLEEVKRNQNLSFLVERAVFHWLKGIFDRVKTNSNGIPDFIAYRDNLKFGFEIKLVRNPKAAISRLSVLLKQASFFLENGFHEFNLVFAVLDESLIEEISRLLKKSNFMDNTHSMGGNLRFLIGKAEIDETSRIIYGFTPYEEIF